MTYERSAADLVADCGWRARLDRLANIDRFTNIFGCAPTDLDCPVPYSFITEINRRSPIQAAMDVIGITGELPPNVFADAQYEGVAHFSQELLDELQAWQSTFADAKGHASKLPQAIAAKIVLLVVFCGAIGRPPPPTLQCLVAASYGFRPGQLAHEVQREYGIAPGVDNLEAFLLAATLDGLADEEGRDLSVAELARKVGAARKTVRRWRDMPEYRGRRQWAFNPAHRACGDKQIEKASRAWAVLLRNSLRHSQPDLFASDSEQG